MERPALSVLVLLVSVSAGCLPQTERFTHRPGDLLFQDTDGGPLCDAIERVTEGRRGAEFTHVGMMARSQDGRLVVIEAISKGVVETPLSEFLARSHDADGRAKVVVGRVRPPHRRLVPRALAEARRLLGSGYDEVFAAGNDRYYCSELVYEVFRRANGGQPLFPLAPMTFQDPATGATVPAWTDYFGKLDAPIPEGEPGINPGSLSRSPKLEIVHVHGTPTGW